MDIASSEDEYQPKEEDEDDESEEEEEDDEEDDWPVLEAGLNNSMVSNPCANGPNFNYWDRGRQVHSDLVQLRASLRKLAIDVAKSGYVNKLASMLREYEPRMLLLPARQESQVGPQQTLFSAAQASGNAAVTELVEEAATDLLFKEISKLPLPDEDIEVGIVQQCLLAGANPTRPGGEAGYVPLQHLCVQIMPFANPKVTNRIEQAASQLTEAAPVVLMMAFTTPSQRATERVGKTTPSQESALPLEAAASNKSLGRVIVPVLSFAMARLLLQRPALAAAPLLRRAVERAHEQFPDVSFVARLVEIVRATAPCLDGASQKGKHPIWEPHCAYESWRFRERRLKVLRPLLEQCDLAQADCEREEAVARLTELEAVLERRRRQHAKEIAQLQVALQKAQRAAEEASAQAQAAQVALQTQRFSREVRAEMQASTDGKTDARVGQSLPKSASSSGSPAELLRNIRQQRGLDIDYTSVPAEVLQSASAMQRSIGAAVERLAIDLYASKGHFLLELIQNADDNRYDEQGAEPSMTLHLGSAEDSSLFFASVNNELGMTNKDVEALCDINRSTKPAQGGKIGKKGVGWKAVFAVSDQPTVLSGDFSFRFDVRCRGRLGYVTPDDLSAQEHAALPPFLRQVSKNAGATVLYLPLRGRPAREDGAAADAGDGGLGIAALIRSSMDRLLQYPAWLLFLRQLCRVAWEDAASSRPQRVSLERCRNSVMVRRVESSTGAAKEEEFAFFVHRKSSVVPQDLLPTGVEPGSRSEEVVIAFQQGSVQEQPAAGLGSQFDADGESSRADPVFCFLPVRPVGFRFSVHAPWSLTSNREDFHLEDPRNVWLRGVAAEALAEAIGRFGSEPGTNVLALLDSRRVLEPFWRRLLEQAVERIGDAPVIPVVGEMRLYKPSEVLVPPVALVRSPGAMKFIHALPMESWPAATGKRLARLAHNQDVAAEDAQRLLSLRAEPLSAQSVKALVNNETVKALLCQHCRSRSPLGLTQVCELLSALLGAAQRESEEVPMFSDAEPRGQESLLDMITQIQQMQVIPLDEGSGAISMTSLAEGDIHLPGSGTWCPGLDQATASTLLAHANVRVLDNLSWNALPSSGQKLLRQLGIREAVLSEVAAAVVRVHALILAESVAIDSFSGTFAKATCEGGEEAELAVLWAGLDVVRLAREQCLDPARIAARKVPGHEKDSGPPDPAACFAPVFRPDNSAMAAFVCPDLRRVLWLPTRSAAGQLRLRRSSSLLLPTFLGLAASEPPRARGMLEEHMGEEQDVEEASEAASTVLPPPPAGMSSGRTSVVAIASSGSQAGGWNELLLLREAFLTEVGCVQPGIENLAVDRVAERLVSRQFWQALSTSPALRRHAARVFRDNHGWLPDLEVPPAPNQPGPGHRINTYFRRGAFEPVVGEAGLAYVDAEVCCQWLLELLRIRCTPDFENLAVALRFWVEKEPPAMCTPKALVSALLQRAIAERESEPERRVSNLLALAILRNHIFIPGKGKIGAQQAVWSAGDADVDFARKVCELAGTSMLEEIYGPSLRCWFCDFLSVRESPGMLQLLPALQRLLPSNAGGEGQALKPSLGFLRRLYAEIMLQLEEHIRDSVVPDSRLKRRRTEEGETGANSLIHTVETQFQSRRLIILPQTRNRPWKFLASSQAYWSVGEELSELPCSQFALKNFYGVQVKARSEECEAGIEMIDLKDFFVKVLGVKEVLTREEIARRLQPPERPSRPQVRSSHPQAADANMDPGSDSGSEELEAEEGHEDDGALDLEDLLGDEAGALSILPPGTARGGRRGDASRRSAQAPQVHDTDVDAAAMRSHVARCCQRTRSAQPAEVLYSGPRAAQPRTATEEVSLRRMSWSHRGTSLYVCGPPSLMGSAEALQELGISIAGRQATVPRGSLLPSAGLQTRFAAFVDAVLLPLASFFQVPIASLAAAVGPGIGRGRNLHGLLCFHLPDGAAVTRHADLCRWFCEMCRLLASGETEGDFSAAEVSSALTAEHMPRFLQFQASLRRRR